MKCSSKKPLKKTTPLIAINTYWTHKNTGPNTRGVIINIQANIVYIKVISSNGGLTGTILTYGLNGFTTYWNYDESFS